MLGTVQFGINYGINNMEGQTPFEEVCRILEIASDFGIHTIDTSSAYGESESVLGKAMRYCNKQFNIVSKYPKSKIGVIESFNNSLQHLAVGSLYGYLVHHFDFYQERPKIYEEMQRLKDEGRVGHIGFSLYSVEQLHWLFDRNVKFDIIQFPYNLFDRQFEPMMKELAIQGIEIHTRSAFLQGLFFKDPSTLSVKLKPLSIYLDKLHNYCKEKAYSIEQLVFGYVLANPYVSGMLIGVDNHNQLKKNILAAGTELKKEDIDFIKSLKIQEKELLNPVNWK